MDNSITLNLSAIDAAVTALVGPGGAAIITELYKVIADAEARGFDRGYKAGENAGHQDGFDVGYDLGYGEGYDKGTEDCIMDDEYVAMNRSPQEIISDEEFYALLDNEMARLADIGVA